MVGKQGAVGSTPTLSGPVHPMKLSVYSSVKGDIACGGCWAPAGDGERSVYTQQAQRATGAAWLVRPEAF